MNEDPLAQLRDIYSPEAVAFWPPAPGWWILAFLIIGGIVAYIVWRHRQAQINQYRFAASKTLAAAWRQYQSDNNHQAYLLQLTQIVKRTALTAYPKININELHNQEWLVFLDNTLPLKASSKKHPFTDGPGQQLLTLPYAPPNSFSGDLTALHNIIMRWLQEHQPQHKIAKLNLHAEPQNPSSPSSKVEVRNVAA